MNPYGLVSVPLVVMAGWLLLHHLWYDFHVQGNYISNGKRTSDLLLGVHVATWTLFVSVPLYLAGTLTVEQFVFLFATHWGMDWFKARKMTPNETSLIIDQVVHVATLGLVLWQW